MKEIIFRVLLAVAILPALGCSTTQTETPELEQVVENQDLEPAPIYDPWEKVNRKIFWFNDKVDVNVLEPIAKGYDELLPDRIQTGVGNFFENLRYPTYLVSDLVQFKFSQALHHTGRFLLNTTVGVLGVLDVAADAGLEKHEEDFGVALAYHGLPSGPYVVIPFIGPSNIRDALGRVVDFATSPFYWYSSIVDVHWQEDWAITSGAKGLDLIDQRADLIEGIESAKSSSLDYYLFMQSAYYQYRLGLLHDGNVPGQKDPFLDDDFEEEDPL
ncbi:MAG: VacJ family lipoprotein [Bdellovibrionales bacterium]|nr:VacJ family lipoprotein [Bdellovibrionales bacterium]